MGVAASWNWFLKQGDGLKVICNDDLVFSPDSLEKVVEHYNRNSMITPINMAANAFSCFVLGEDLITHVGYFDESISPNYGYFEDNDYYRRMELAGYKIEFISDCIVGHHGSSTIKKMTRQEREAHNQKFSTAQSNYVRKWGGSPGKEKFTIPHGLK